MIFLIIILLWSQLLIIVIISVTKNADQTSIYISWYEYVNIFIAVHTILCKKT